MRTYLSFLLTFLILGCGSKSSVARVGKATEESLNSFYYALPKSSLVVTFDVEKKIEKPGIYKDVAPFFGFDDEIICKKKTTSFKIAKTDISTKTYFDEKQVFKYNFSKNFLNKNEFKIEYAVNGEIINSEMKTENQILPFISTTLGFASDVLSNLKATKITTYTTTIPKRKNFKTTKEFNSANKLFKRAKIDFNSLKELKVSYYEALKSENGATKEIVELKLKKLEDAINDLTIKFTGLIEKKVYQISYEIDPYNFTDVSEKDIVSLDSSKQKIDLFSFDGSKGIKRLLKQDWFSPITEIEDETISDDSKYSIFLNKIDSELKNKISQDYNKRKDKGAFFYRIPVNAKFIIKNNDTNIKSFDIAIPQYGLTLAAPDNMKSLNFKLHPTLGSILSVEGTTKTTDFDAVAKVGTSSSDLLSKLKKEQEPNKKDELIKELERDVKIKELQQQLNNTED